MPEKTNAAITSPNNPTNNPWSIALVIQTSKLLSGMTNPSRRRKTL